MPWLIEHIPDLQKSIFDPPLFFSPTKLMAILLCTDNMLVAMPKWLLHEEAAIEKRFECHARKFIPAGFKGVNVIQKKTSYFCKWPTSKRKANPTICFQRRRSRNCTASSTVRISHSIKLLLVDSPGLLHAHLRLPLVLLSWHCKEKSRQYPFCTAAIMPQQRFQRINLPPFDMSLFGLLHFTFVFSLTVFPNPGGQALKDWLCILPF